MHFRADAMDFLVWYDKYTDPIVDGRKNSVMGRGQIGMIKDSDKPFADDVVYFNQS